MGTPSWRPMQSMRVFWSRREVREMWIVSWWCSTSTPHGHCSVWLPFFTDTADSGYLACGEVNRTIFVQVLLILLSIILELCEIAIHFQFVSTEAHPNGQNDKVVGKHQQKSLVHILWGADRKREQVVKTKPVVKTEPVGKADKWWRQSQWVSGSASSSPPQWLPRWHGRHTYTLPTHSDTAVEKKNQFTQNPYHTV